MYQTPHQILQQIKEIWTFMGLKYREKQFDMLQPIAIINCAMVIFAGKVKDLKNIGSLNGWLKG